MSRLYISSEENRHRFELLVSYDVKPKTMALNNYKLLIYLAVISYLVQPCYKLSMQISPLGLPRAC